MSTTAANRKRKLAEAGITDIEAYLISKNVPKSVHLKDLHHLSVDQKQLVEICRKELKCQHSYKGQRKKQLTMDKCREILSTAGIDDANDYLVSLNVPKRTPVERLKHLTDEQKTLVDVARQVIQNKSSKPEPWNSSGNVGEVDPQTIATIEEAQQILDQNGVVQQQNLSNQPYLHAVRARKDYLQNLSNMNTGRNNQRPYSVLQDVRSSAYHNNIALELTKDQILYVSGLPCNYCNKPPPSGIDRMNSNGIYLMGNVLPACTQCNRSKGGHLPDVFIGLAHVITRHLTDSSYKFHGIPYNRGGNLTFHSWIIGRVHEVKITEEEYFTLIESDCYYCGVTKCGGVDRTEPSGIYITGNVVPACWICNRLKADMTYNDFINMLQRIIDTNQYVEHMAPITCEHTSAVPCFNTGLCGACYYNKHVNSHRVIVGRKPYERRAHRCIKCKIMRPKRFYADDFEVCVDCKKILINV